MIMIPSRNPPESLSAMLNATDDAVDVPIVTVPHKVYDAILLAKRVMVVSQEHGAADFFEIRQCLMTAAAEPGPPPPDRATLLRCMVGG